MFPVHPPFPLASNLLFQPAAGIHTSILMSESGVGLSVAATRQNAGRSENLAAACMPCALAGATNAPACTACATVTVPSGTVMEARLSHDTPNAGSPHKNAAKKAFIEALAAMLPPFPRGRLPAVAPRPH